MKKSFYDTCLLLFCVALFCEVTAYSSQDLLPELYNASDVALEPLYHDDAPAAFDQFMKTQFSPATGWTPPKSFTWKEKDCAGHEHEYTTDAYGTRPYNGYDREQATVLLGGDSFTWGQETENDGSIAARVFQQSGIISANLGYKAFGPVQAFLRLQSERKNFPRAKVAVLGIMDENINRMVNSYRPVYVNFGTNFTLKPYMKDGAIQPLDLKDFTSFTTFRAAAESAFKTDYWARPEHSFPYIISFVRALTTPAIKWTVGTQIMEHFGRAYELQYRDDYLGDNLLALVSAFGRWAQQEKLVPVVVFIPVSFRDLHGPEEWQAKYAGRLPKNVTVRRIDTTKIDMSKYNILATNDNCHPSAYGYGELGRQYTDILRDALSKGQP